MGKEKKKKEIRLSQARFSFANNLSKRLMGVGRGTWIRTRDLMLPKHAR